MRIDERMESEPIRDESDEKSLSAIVSWAFARNLNFEEFTSRMKPFFAKSIDSHVADDRNQINFKELFCASKKETILETLEDLWNDLEFWKNACTNGAFPFEHLYPLLLTQVLRTCQLIFFETFHD